jgi:hypothetical protein
MKLIIMQSSAASRHFLLLRSKYSPQQFITIINVNKIQYFSPGCFHQGGCFCFWAFLRCIVLGLWSGKDGRKDDWAINPDHSLSQLQNIWASCDLHCVNITSFM